MESKNYRLNESKMFADITDGIAIIINAATGIYYGMNGYGTGIFDNLLAGSSTDDILAAIQEIPGAPANAEESLSAFPWWPKTPYSTSSSRYAKSTRMSRNCFTPIRSTKSARKKAGSRKSRPTAMPAVSVIVPVFNSEAFLDKCLESLACQTLADLEVICVDDHSTDGSPAILNRRTAGDSRFKVITFADNRGPSAARNAALDAALGEYVAFVDSDDFIAPDFLEKLYQAAVSGDADVAKGTEELRPGQGRLLPAGDLQPQLPHQGAQGLVFHDLYQRHLPHPDASRTRNPV